MHRGPRDSNREEQKSLLEDPMASHLTGPLDAKAPILWVYINEFTIRQRVSVWAQLLIKHPELKGIYVSFGECQASTVCILYVY